MRRNEPERDEDVYARVCAERDAALAQRDKAMAELEQALADGDEAIA